MPTLINQPDETDNQIDQILNDIEEVQRGSSDDEIKLDKYWDQSGAGAVRTSSDQDPTKYYDSSQAYRESDGRSLASLLPSGRDLPRGTVIPRARRFGGSMGWNPHKPQIVNIDPDIPGQASVVDLSQITPELVEAAMQKTAHITDPRLAAASVFRKLACGTEPINQPRVKPEEDDRAHHGVLAGAYVVPKSTRGGAQIQPKQSIKPSERFAQRQPVSLVQGNPPRIEKTGNAPLTEAEATQIENQMIQQMKSEPKLASKFDQSKQKTANKSQVASEPAELVTYEVDGFGHITYPYHKAIREDFCLVLAYDTSFSGHKFFLEPNDKKPLIVDVHSHAQVYKVLSTGIHFTLDDYEICVLLIVDEAEK